MSDGGDKTFLRVECP